MNDGKLAFCITDIGLYMLRRTDDFDDEQVEEIAIIVQLNFEAFFFLRHHRMVNQFPDLETAAKVYKAGSKIIEEVNDIVLICTDQKQRHILIRKLRDKGVFGNNNSKTPSE